MAVLTANQRIKVSTAIQRAYSSEAMPMGWSKAELASEVANVDVWQDGNQTTIGLIFSALFRGKSNAADLALIFIVVAIARRLVSNPGHLRVLRNLINEVAGIQ